MERNGDVEMNCDAEFSGLGHGASAAEGDLRREMLERLADNKELFSRLQQRDEPDMSRDECISYCSDLLQNKPAEFLARFGAVLSDVELKYFELFVSDCAVCYGVEELKQRFNAGGGLTRSVVKNRRFEAMKRLECSGEYFSDEEMKKRDPLLYEEMIGQFLTNEEAVELMQKQQQQPSSGAQIQLSELLLQHLQVQQNNELYQRQVDLQEGQLEEEEEEEEDDDDNEEKDADTSDDDTSANEKSGSAGQQLSEYEKAVLRNEFVETMKQRFLNGEDAGFDYSKVDNNTDFDSLDQLSRDAEDKYFDDDDDDMIDDDNDNRNTSYYDY